MMRKNPRLGYVIFPPFLTSSVHPLLAPARRAAGTASARPERGSMTRVSPRVWFMYQLMQDDDGKRR